MTDEKHQKEELYWRLQAYTLSIRDPDFIHQHVVDAWTAQHARADTKPIALAFALIGLYLHVERDFSGRAVQRVHMKLAERKEEWPTFPLPTKRGRVTAKRVLAASEGGARKVAIDAWCASVWGAYSASHKAVAGFLEEHGIT